MAASFIQFANAQLLLGGSYKRFIPASDTSKYVYKTGGGLEAQAGLGLGKKAGIYVVGTVGIDILKINHKTNSETKDGWIFTMGGLRKDITFGKAKKEGLAGYDKNPFSWPLIMAYRPVITQPGLPAMKRNR